MPDKDESTYRTAAETGDADAANKYGCALFDRGALLYQLGRESEAEKWWRKAVDGGNHVAAHNIGVLFGKRGRAVEAEYWYGRARAMQRKNSEVPASRRLSDLPPHFPGLRD